MALLHPYCTVAQVQAKLGNANAALAATIEDVINAASRFIDQTLNRDYLQHEFTAQTPLVIYERSNCVFGDQLFLPYRPIITTTALTVKEGAVSLTESSATVEGGFVRFDAFLMRVGQSWAIGNTLAESITITGKFGYAQTSSASVPSGIPANITRACVLIAANLTGENKVNWTSAEGDTTSIIQASIPKEAVQLLGFRRLTL